MNQDLMGQLEKLDIEDLREIKDFINQRINNLNHHSFNNQVFIQDICYDDDLKKHLLSRGITNMTELKNNGYTGISESFIEKTNWLLTRFDFDSLERKIPSKHK